MGIGGPCVPAVVVNSIICYKVMLLRKDWGSPKGTPVSELFLSDHPESLATSEQKWHELSESRSINVTEFIDLKILGI